MAYDLSNNALLSPQAQDLQIDDAAQFEALQEVAEARLCLTDTEGSFTGTKLVLARQALVAQINFMIETSGIAGIYKSIKKGDRTLTYANVGDVSPIALQYLNAIGINLSDKDIDADVWGVIRSLR